MTHDELLAKIKNNEADMCSLIVMDDDKCEPIHGIYDALRAIVELHKGIALALCDDEACCGTEIICEDCNQEYPCETIQAIEKELK